MKPLSLAFLLIAATAHAAPWTSQGPSGGSALAIVAAPSDHNVLYAGTTGGLFRTADGGTMWTNVSGPHPYVAAIAVDPHDPRTVFAAGDKLYKSTDGGTTWVAPLSGLPAVQRVTAILIDPRDSSVVYAGMRCGAIGFKGGPAPAPDWHEFAGVYKSTDGGRTFAAATSGMAGFQLCVEEMTFDPVSPDTIYATPVYTDFGYARTDDGAKTWTRAATSLPGKAAVADPYDAAKRYGIGLGAFLVSGDSGKSWFPITTKGILPSLVIYLPFSALTIDPNTGRLFAASGSGVYRSGDGGYDWLPLGGAGRQTVSSLAYDPTTGRLTIGTANAVARSTGYPWNDWEELSTGDLSLPMARIAASQRDPAAAWAASGSRLYVTHDSGASWQSVPALPLSNGQAPFLPSLVVDPADNLWASTPVGGSNVLYKLPAGSSQWVTVVVPGSPSSSYGTNFGAPVFDPHDANTFYIPKLLEFQRTRDGGVTWERVPVPPYAGGLVIDPRDSNVLYTALIDGLYKSTDAGRTWTKKTDASVPVISPADPDTLYAGTRIASSEQLLSRSRDGGETWTTFHWPVTDTISSIVADRENPLRIYIGTSNHGAFESDDGGATWFPISDGLPKASIMAMSLSRDGATLHAATGRGVWELPLRTRGRALRER